MTVLAITKSCPNVMDWVSEFSRLDEKLKVYVWPDVPDKLAVEFVLVWNSRDIRFSDIPNVKAIFSVRAGVEEVLENFEIPASVPIIRIQDPTLARSMVEYVLMRCLHYHRMMPEFAEQQELFKWKFRPYVPTSNRTVGILGLGQLGQACAHALSTFGFRVLGWSRRGRTIPNVEVYSGVIGLAQVLSESEVLICMLPLTLKTEGILNKECFCTLPRGARLINVGRGKHLNETDLIEALKSGQLSHATLDVLRDEPLGSNHPFWMNPKITITPHIAGQIRADSAAHGIVCAIQRWSEHSDIPFTVDRENGY